MGGKWSDRLLLLQACWLHWASLEELWKPGQILDQLCKARHSSFSGASEHPNKKTTGSSLQESSLLQSTTWHLLCILSLPLPLSLSSCFFTRKSQNEYCRSTFFTLWNAFIRAWEVNEPSAEGAHCSKLPSAQYSCGNESSVPLVTCTPPRATPQKPDGAKPGPAITQLLHKYHAHVFLFLAVEMT